MQPTVLYWQPADTEMYFTFLLMRWALMLQLPGELPAKGALMANPCFTQIHPTCIPVSGDYQSKLTLMSESLRNDGTGLGAGQKRRCRSNSKWK